MKFLRKMLFVRAALLVVTACMVLQGVFAASALAAMDAKRLSHGQPELPFALVICTPEGIKTLAPTGKTDGSDAQSCECPCASLCAGGTFWDVDPAEVEAHAFVPAVDATAGGPAAGAQSPAAKAVFDDRHARAPPA